MTFEKACELAKELFNKGVSIESIHHVIFTDTGSGEIANKVMDKVEAEWLGWEVC